MTKKLITTEKLAGMIGKGFEDVCGRIDNMKNEVNIRLDNIEQGQEDIKLRLGNTAFQFDVDDLKKRVRKLEFKLGIKTK